MKISKDFKLKKLIVLLFLLTIYVFIAALSYTQAVSSNIADSVFRLHVIANSDSKEDQALKLKVRDELLKYMNDLSKDCSSKEEVINLAEEHKEDFKKIAENTIKENGFGYDVDIQIGKADFPTKTYGDISLPEGTYDALKVKIGKAEGKNWWCVMFPPLCFVDVSSGVVPDTSKEELKESLDSEEYDLISKNNDNTIKLKFKIVELFQSMKLGQK